MDQGFLSDAVRVAPVTGAAPDTPVSDAQGHARQGQARSQPAPAQEPASESAAQPPVLAEDVWEPHQQENSNSADDQPGYAGVLAGTMFAGETEESVADPAAEPQEDFDPAQAVLRAYFQRLENRPAWRWHGHVVEATGQSIESEGPFCSVGECCEILDSEGRRHGGEVIGFRGSHVLSMTLDAPDGIRYGDPVAALGETPRMNMGPGLLGRVLDALGQPLDGEPPPHAEEGWPLESLIPQPMDRVPITTPLGTGLRVLDGLLTAGRGQRVGIFGGSGVGKSTLIGMMTRYTAADLTVVGLVGERGREVREFLEDNLGTQGRARSVVLVSTSDQSPLLRMRAAQAATAVAEYYAAQGKHVLLVLDSLTRYAMAAREVGLAAGEPPTSRGYTPSVFRKLARLIERAGQFNRGSITAFYTVLMEGDDLNDPLVDAARSLLDGHIVLSRAMAGEGWYPPVSVLDSISRLMPAVTTPPHRERASLVRRLLSAYARSEDLVRIGAYKPGADPELDRALAARPALRRYMEQTPQEHVTLDEAVTQMQALPL
jgi:flagellum-specific ATP synthase